MKSDRIPRKTARQVVLDFIATAIRKLENGEPCHPAARAQLEIFKQIAREMGWLNAEKRITKALTTTPIVPDPGKCPHGDRPDQCSFCY